jgi:hypothetical protein
MQLKKKINRALRQLREPDQTRISPKGMPNGFYVNNLLWYGDGGSQETAVSRGFIVEPGEMETRDEGSKVDLSDRLCRLQATLGEQFAMQVRRVAGGDYSDVLEGYRKHTEAIKDRGRHRWQIWARTERYERYRAAMEEGKLRRESLVLFFTRVIDTAPPFTLSPAALRKHVGDLARRESLAFEQVQLDALQTIFPDCRVRAMTDREHHAHYYRFLNPSVGATLPERAFRDYDPSLSIQQNCLFSCLVQPPIPGISFQLDRMNHALLVMRELPKRIGPGLITRVLDLGFGDVEIVLNLYPQNLPKVIKAFEATADQLAGEVRTQPKRVHSLGTQHQMAAERIVALERGEVLPVNVFFAVRLWHKDPETVLSRVEVVKNAVRRPARSR